MLHTQTSRAVWPLSLLTICLLMCAAPRLASGRPQCPGGGNRPITLELFVCGLREASSMNAQQLRDLIRAIEQVKIDFDLTADAESQIRTAARGKLTPPRLTTLLAAVRNNRYSPPPPPPVLPKPAVAFCADSTFIVKGQTVGLLWETTNATSVNIQPPLYDTPRLLGTSSVYPETNTIYTLKAQGTGGTEAKSLTITVAPAAGNAEFEWVSSQAFLQSLREINNVVEGNFMPIVDTLRWTPDLQIANSISYCSKVGLPGLSCKIWRDQDGNSLNCESRTFEANEVAYRERVYEAIKEALLRAAPQGSASEETIRQWETADRSPRKSFRIKYGIGGWRGTNHPDTTGDNQWKFWPGATLNLDSYDTNRGSIYLTFQGSNKNRPFPTRP